MMSQPEDDDETRDEYSKPWKVALSAGQLEERRRRLEAASVLSAELIRADGERQAEMLRQPHFQNLDLLDHLLEESHHRQLTETVLAEDLAVLAGRLATLLAGREVEARSALCRAFCLGANARRLGSDPDGADALLAKAVPFLQFQQDRAFYSRTAALVRWEQGRLDEADALLRHATRLFAREGLEIEVAACRGLHGLLREEEGDLGDPMMPLSRGWASMAGDLRPEILLRVGLALAALQAERQRPNDARQTLKDAWALFGEIQDEGEIFRVYWSEARALALLGERNVALQTLESIRQKLLREPFPAEAVLLSVDLAVLLAEDGKTAEIEALIRDLRPFSAFDPVYLLAMGSLDNLQAELGSGKLDPRKTGRDVASVLRRTFRARRVRLKPLPFS